MSRVGDDFGGPAKERSGWLIPLAVFVVTAVLSAIILIYYLGPRPAQLGIVRPAPTDASDLVMLSVGETGFDIPANYILFADARRGGALDELSMAALLPDLQGYTLGTAQDFASNAPDSRVVNMVVRAETVALSDADRLNRVYLPFVANPEGETAMFGVRVYDFRDDTGYRNEQLFVGQDADGPALLRCTKPGADVPSPSCLGDVSLGGNLVLTYRFKRAHLERWQEIESSIRALIGAFTVKR